MEGRPGCPFFPAHPERSDQRNTFHALLSCYRSQHGPHQRLPRVYQSCQIILNDLIRLERQEGRTGQPLFQELGRISHQAICQAPIFARKSIDIPRSTERTFLSPSHAIAYSPRVDCASTFINRAAKGPCPPSARRLPDSVCGTTPPSHPSSRVKPSCKMRRQAKGGRL